MSVDRRSFTEKQRIAIFVRQGGKCAICKLKLHPGAYDIDHTHALALGGDNADDNLRAIHRRCHQGKTKQDVQALAKIDRIVAGGTKRKGTPIPGSRCTRFKKKLDGSVEFRRSSD